MRRITVAVLSIAIVLAFIAGASMRTNTRAQEDANKNRIIVRGHGSAKSSEKPPGQQLTFIAADTPQHSFKTVPPGKKLVITDIFCNPRGVHQNLTVNLAMGKLMPERTPVPYVADILDQIDMTPGEPRETHLCTGYEFPSSYSVMAWTNAGLEADQWVSIEVTGYLVDN